MKPLGYFASARREHPDVALLEQIEQACGSRLEKLNTDDKASVLICLIDAVHNTQQTSIIDANFHKEGYGCKLWKLASQLSPKNKLMVAASIMAQLSQEGENLL